MTRKCSHCSHNGHNSRTCPNRGVMLFGVRLGDGLIRKSASMGNLSVTSGSIRKSASMGNLFHAPASGGGASPVDGQEPADGGYASEDLAQRAAREPKRGTPWTEEEHRLFLLGLQKLGKGDWRGISRSYVITRTPTQVASHAQKYFIRQSNMSRRKRRSSVFDMVPDEPAEPEPIPMNYQESEAQNNNPSQAPPTETPNEEFKAVDANNSVVGEAKNQQPATVHCSYPVPLPVYFPPPFMPYPFCVWPGYAADISVQKAYEIFKPTAVHTRNPVNVDELGGMSKMNIGGSSGESALLGGSKRQSAFHANRPTGPLSSSHPS